MNRRPRMTLFPRIDKTTPYRTSYRITRFVQYVFMASVLVYVLVAWQLTVWVPVASEGFVSLPEQTYVWVVAVAVIIAVTLIVAQVVAAQRLTEPRILLKRRRIRTLEELGYYLSQAQTLHTTLAESVAVLGVVLFLLNGRWVHMLPFAAVGLLMHLLYLPRWEDWEEARKLFEREQMLRGD